MLVFSLLLHALSPSRYFLSERREGKVHLNTILEAHCFSKWRKNEWVRNYFIRTSTHRYIQEKLLILASKDAEINA